MREPSLAQNVEWCLMAAGYDRIDAFEWLLGNRDRILAALRGNEEDARIARIVREPTDAQAQEIGVNVDSETAWIAQGREVCRTIVALANEHQF